MKLELKYIKGYLDTNLNVKRTFNNEIMVLHGISGNHTIEALDANDSEMCALLAFGNCQIDYDEAFKPILRPLSDLTKEIEVNGEKFVPAKKLEWGKTRYFDVMKYKDIGIEITYNESKKLYEWHFDIYGLIENNLAIDINTL